MRDALIGSAKEDLGTIVTVFQCLYYEKTTLLSFHSEKPSYSPAALLASRLWRIRVTSEQKKRESEPRHQ